MALFCLSYPRTTLPHGRGRGFAAHRRLDWLVDDHDVFEPVDPLVPSVRVLELVEGTFCEVGHAADDGSIAVAQPFLFTVAPHALSA
jgi:hypothetical protein